MVHRSHYRVEQWAATIWKRNGRSSISELSAVPSASSVGISDRGQIVGGAEDATPDSFDFGGQLSGPPLADSMARDSLAGRDDAGSGWLGGPWLFRPFFKRASADQRNLVHRFDAYGLRVSGGSPVPLGRRAHGGPRTLGGVWAISTGLNNRGDLVGLDQRGRPGEPRILLVPGINARSGHPGRLRLLLGQRAQRRFGDRGHHVDGGRAGSRVLVEARRDD